MAKRIVNPKYHADKPPLLATFVAVLAMDHWGAPGWVWGLTLGVGGLLCVACIVSNLAADWCHPKDV